jgi:hypothetical protein
VTPFDDHDLDPRLSREIDSIDSDAIEALVRGDDVRGSDLEDLAAFARELRSLGHQRVPPMSLELAVLVMRGAQARPVPQRAPRTLAPTARTDPSARTGWAAPSARTAPSAPATRTVRAGPTRPARSSRAAGLTAAVKVMLAAVVAFVGVVSAGVAGVLPSGASDAVRGTIEAVIPVELEVPPDTPGAPGAPTRTPAAVDGGEAVESGTGGTAGAADEDGVEADARAADDSRAGRGSGDRAGEGTGSDRSSPQDSEPGIGPADRKVADDSDQSSMPTPPEAADPAPAPEPGSERDSDAPDHIPG